MKSNLGGAPGAKRSGAHELPGPALQIYLYLVSGLCQQADRLRGTQSTGTGADCTVASPCPCLSAAVGKVTAGDTIEVAADGTYKGACNKDITLDTPATHDITIKGTGGKAVFDFEGNGRAFR